MALREFFLYVAYSNFFVAYPSDWQFQGFYLCEIFYFGAITFAKTSVLLFYARVFPGESFRKWVYAVMVVSLCYGFAYIIVVAFQCLPVSYSWTRWDGEHNGTCIDINTATWPASVFNISIDLVIIILPIPRLIKLNLSRRKKIQVIAMFCVGLLYAISPFHQGTRNLMHSVLQLSVSFD